MAESLAELSALADSLRAELHSTAAELRASQESCMQMQRETDLLVYRLNEAEEKGSRMGEEITGLTEVVAGYERRLVREVGEHGRKQRELELMTKAKEQKERHMAVLVREKEKALRQMDLIVANT